VHRFAALSDLERAAVTQTTKEQAPRVERNSTTKRLARSQELIRWECKQINRAERAKREGVKA
jgi:hypothetical protein